MTLTPPHRIGPQARQRQHAEGCIACQQVNAEFSLGEMRFLARRESATSHFSEEKSHPARIAALWRGAASMRRTGRPPGVVSLLQSGSPQGKVRPFAPRGDALEPLNAMLFGLAVAAPVGPIALLLVHTGVNHRLSAALRAALGVAAADLTYAVIAFTLGAALTSALSAHRRELQL